MKRMKKGRCMRMVIAAMGMFLMSQMANAQLFGGEKGEEAEGLGGLKELFKGGKKTEGESPKTKEKKQTSQSGGVKASKQWQIGKKNKAGWAKYDVNRSGSKERAKYAPPVMQDGFGDSTKVDTKVKSLGFDVPDTAYVRQYTFRGLTPGEKFDATVVTDTTMPAGFKKVITNLDFYDQGEDLRMIDDDGRIVTLEFEPKDKERLKSVSIDDIEDLNYVKRLQREIRRQMGEPMIGYEVIKNYDGEGNGMWQDYSTYEFVYRYRYYGKTYDFRVEQKGVKMRKRQILHPYDFTASVVSGPLTQVKPDVIDADKPQEAVVDEQNKHFYPIEGTHTEGGYVVETKILNRW